MIPDYKQIYTDILKERFPEKLIDKTIRNKLERLDSAIDVLKFNQMIFGEPEYSVAFNNQRLRSYDKESILEILEYQKKNKLTNIQLSSHFKISRNTITKWKAVFKI
ncbi:helix-turn-helix domain-containing protein [Chryseobacterium sp. G0186]|uniref:helix-turn-helix domain-containing protein n=1 Tax=Chryseobacterium sp. G0186 TaxID=2487064 RepID=UPI000F4D8E22|nr:helix-turn-helix domain-containing protein [Chryseobacterium sp. G0186]AZA78874.1 helix-turn-helix domain-containing protein [Chryseobacterium sp. G0186]